MTTRVSRSPRQDQSKMLELAYEYFIERKFPTPYFSIDDICRYTNHRPGTVRGYISKKWLDWFLGEAPQEGYYYYRQPITVSKEKFVREHSQLWYPPDPWMGKNDVMVWVFLLMFLVAYYERSRHWRIKIWSLRLPF